MPHQRLPFWFKPLLFLAGIVPGIALLLISLIYIPYFVVRFFSNPSDLLIPMLYGLALGIAWFLWMHIPLALIRLLRRRRK